MNSIRELPLQMAQEMPVLDPWRLRRDFPILAAQVHGKPLVYLDNAATTQKPQAVIDAISDYYRSDNANVHRGVHTLSERATAAFEGAREKVRRFINARDTREVVFVRGATEAINLVASSYGRTFLKPGDEVLITEMEHHSNIVPWQLVCAQTGAVLRVVPIDERGELQSGAYEEMLNERTRIVALSHMSNALGTVNPVAAMAEMAHRLTGAVVLLDGAQAAAHLPVDVQALGCDFYVFSAHKLYGPTGIGVLYGRSALLEIMPPYQGGGDMISRVSFKNTTYNSLPYKFEAGTPDIAGAAGVSAALDYLQAVGLPAIAAHEHDLLVYATERLSELPGIRLVGTARNKASVLSFELEGVHPHDIGTILDQEGIAIRTGHHCAMPVMDHFGVPATARASFALYNVKEEVDALVEGLERVQRMFAG